MPACSLGEVSSAHSHKHQRQTLGAIWGSAAQGHVNLQSGGADWWMTHIANSSTDNGY